MLPVSPSFSNIQVEICFSILFTLFDDFQFILYWKEIDFINRTLWNRAYLPVLTHCKPYLKLKCYLKHFSFNWRQDLFYLFRFLCVSVSTVSFIIFPTKAQIYQLSSLRKIQGAVYFFLFSVNHLENLEHIFQRPVPHSSIWFG